MLSVGMKYKETIKVTEDKLANAMGSGAVPVFATPMMVLIMEEVSALCVKDELEAGQATVGTKLDVSHVSATPAGLDVTAECELIEIDKRRLVFKVAAYDNAGLIGEGTHERFIIDVEKFMSKTNGKLSSNV